MNTKTLIKRFSEYAKQGDIFCQEMLKNIEKDTNYGVMKLEKMKSLYYSLIITLRNDAEQGNADAQYCLGLSFFNREGLFNPSEGIKWLYLAVSQGHAKTHIIFGTILLHFAEEICGLDEEESLSWIQRAVEQGNIEVIGIIEEFNGSIKFITNATETSYYSACFNLGTKYSKDKNTEISDQKFFHWMLKAAEAGYMMAQLCVAYDYYTGTGTLKNLRQARYWFMRAMEQEYENKSMEE